MDRSRYRHVNFVGGRILQAREVKTMQDIVDGLNPATRARTARDLNAVYKDGATLNVQLSITGKQVTLAQVDTNLPMLVFVRGRWEAIKTAEVGAGAGSVTLATNQTKLYLNWALAKIVYGPTDTDLTDSQLLDALTEEATAEMGELRLDISATDTSGDALNTGTQIEKNTSTIELFSFVHTSDSVTADAKDNVEPQALATPQTAGLVKTTGASAVVVSDGDARLTDQRVPTDGSVTDAKVHTPTSGSDATAVSTDKIVHHTTDEILDTVITGLQQSDATITARQTAHEGAALGQGTTHPFPTCAQVGATPASHQSTGLDAAHGLAAAKNSGGFSVTRDKAVAPTVGDPAYDIKDQDGSLAKLTHDGDVFAKKANTANARTTGSVTGGVLGLLSKVATVLAGHTNQVGGGTPTDANPHGLTLADLGYAPPDPEDPNFGPIYEYIDAQIALTRAYVDSRTDFELRGENGWLIVHVHNIEVAFWVGMIGHGEQLTPPAGFSDILGMASMGGVDCEYDEDNPAHFRFNMNPGNWVVAQEWSAKKGMHYGNASVVAVAWRTV